MTKTLTQEEAERLRPLVAADRRLRALVAELESLTVSELAASASEATPVWAKAGANLGSEDPNVRSDPVQRVVSLTRKSSKQKIGLTPLGSGGMLDHARSCRLGFRRAAWPQEAAGEPSAPAVP